MQGVSKIEEEENLLVRQDNRDQHYLQIWSFTAFCNWLDVVEIRFTSQGSGTCFIVLTVEPQIKDILNKLGCYRIIQCSLSINVHLLYYTCNL